MTTQEIKSLAIEETNRAFPNWEFNRQADFWSMVNKAEGYIFVYNSYPHLKASLTVKEYVAQKLSEFKNLIK